LLLFVTVTTITPNIGVLEYSDRRQITMADLPGLIEGAHMNIGMGHSFLKHVERTKLLLLVADIQGFQLGPQFPNRSCLDTVVLLNKVWQYLYMKDLRASPL
jgi:serine/threonine-protein kinase OSR1/STK39